MSQQKETRRSYLKGGADYFILLKPRVMSLVVFTAVAGMAIAPGKIELWRGFLAIIAIALGGGASGALNMWYDADIDSIMKRTINRPIPSGRIAKDRVLCFGLSLAIFSVLILYWLTNWFASAFLAFTIFFYIVIYTIWLKRRTWQNIVIGGAAGAFPPAIGYACVTGGLSIESVLLFLLIFLWTPPHFWALSLFATTDYEAANIPMLPNVRGVRVTQNYILFYTIVMAVTSLFSVYYLSQYYCYGIVAYIMNFIFVWKAYLLYREDDDSLIRSRAKNLFFLSLLYLSLLFSSLLIQQILLKLLS